MGAQIHRGRLACRGAAALALVLASLAASAQPFPSRPVTMIVPFPGGSTTDTFARIIAENMEPALGQKVIVDPRPGAGTVIGAQYVLNQPADGYTLLQATNSVATKSAGLKPPFDARKDFAPVGQINVSGLVLAVNDKLPVRTAKELVDYVRANPGKLNGSHFGVGTSAHLGIAMLMSEFKLSVAVIPYNGSVQNALALAQGNADFTFDVVGSLRPHVQANRVRMIATSLSERDPGTPDLPGMTESGVPGFNLRGWTGYLVRAGTPNEAIQKLNAAASAAVKSKPVRDHFAKVNIYLNPDISTPDRFRQTITQDVDMLYKLIRDAKLDID